MSGFTSCISHICDDPRKLFFDSDNTESESEVGSEVEMQDIPAKKLVDAAFSKPEGVSQAGVKAAPKPILSRPAATATTTTPTTLPVTSSSPSSPNQVAGATHPERFPTNENDSRSYKTVLLQNEEAATKVSAIEHVNKPVQEELSRGQSPVSVSQPSVVAQNADGRLDLAGAIHSIKPATAMPANKSDDLFRDLVHKFHASPISRDRHPAVDSFNRHSQQRSETLQRVNTQPLVDNTIHEPVEEDATAADEQIPNSKEQDHARDGSDADEKKSDDEVDIAVAPLPISISIPGIALEPKSDELFSTHILPIPNLPIYTPTARASSNDEQDEQDEQDEGERRRRLKQLPEKPERTTINIPEQPVINNDPELPVSAGADVKGEQDSLAISNSDPPSDEVLPAGEEESAKGEVLVQKHEHIISPEINNQPILPDKSHVNKPDSIVYEQEQSQAPSALQPKQIVNNSAHSGRKIRAPSAKPKVRFPKNSRTRGAPKKQVNPKDSSINAASDVSGVDKKVNDQIDHTPSATTSLISNNQTENAPENEANQQSLFHRLSTNMSSYLPNSMFDYGPPKSPEQLAHMQQVMRRLQTPLLSPHLHRKGPSLTPNPTYPPLAMSTVKLQSPTRIPTVQISAPAIRPQSANRLAPTTSKPNDFSNIAKQAGKFLKKAML